MRTLLLFLMIGLYLQLNAQDTSANIVQDSTLVANQEERSQLKAMADSARIADSIEQQNLLTQLDALRSSDIAEKERLQSRLDSMSKVRAQRDLRLKRQVDSLRSSTIGVPVIFNRDTLFLIYTKLGPFSPTERAARISEKLVKLGDDASYDEKKLVVFASEDGFDLMYSDLILLSINAKDAFWANKPASEVAAEYKQQINAAVLSYRDENGIFKILMRIGLLLLVGLILYLIVRFLNIGFSKLVVKIARSSDKYMKGIKLKEYEFLSPERELQLAIWLLNALKWLLILLIVYIALPVIFSIFPTTEGVARTLFGYVLNPMKDMLSSIIGFIPELIAIIVIIGVTRYFVRFLKFLSSEVQTGKLVLPGFYPDWAMPTFNLLRVIIYAFSFIVIFPYLPGSDSPIFQGVSVFLGLLISLGSSSAIGNIVAGLVITYMRPFKLGDRVKIGDVTGDVVEKNMLVTRVRTIKNEDISIPNSAILNGSTINYTSNAQDLGLILHTGVTIGYDVPWKEVHELLIGAALKAELVSSEPKPFVLQTSLDDFYVSYQLNAYTSSPEKAAKIYSDIHSNIQDAFKEANVEILSPHYRAQRDGSETTIPK